MLQRFGSMLIGVSLMIVAVTTVGCARRSAGTVPVSGVVLVDGKPLANAAVIFFRDDLDSRIQSFVGTTDGNGRYQLISGARPGEYRVIIKGQSGQPASSIPNAGTEGVDEAQLQIAAAAKQKRLKSGRGAKKLSQLDGVLASIYTSPQQSVLRVDVPTNGTKMADLNLTTTQPAKASAGSQVKEVRR